jgi:hypothetical protein
MIIYNMYQQVIRYFFRRLFFLITHSTNTLYICMHVHVYANDWKWLRSKAKQSGLEYLLLLLIRLADCCRLPCSSVVIMVQQLLKEPETQKTYTNEKWVLSKQRAVKGYIFIILCIRRNHVHPQPQGAGVSRFTWPGYWSGRSPAWFLSPVVGPYTNKMKKETHCVTCVCSRKATVRTGRPMVVWMYASC